MDGFNSLMDTWPYTTQAVISLVLQVAGDTIAQVFIEKKRHWRTYDYVRSAKFALIGFLCGFVIYKWYEFLDEAIVLSGELATALVKLAGEKYRYLELVPSTQPPQPTRSSSHRL